MANILLINLNRCIDAQSLMAQVAIEEKAALVAVVEPHTIPEHPRWIADKSGLAAIYVPGNVQPRRVIRAGEGYVAAEWGGMGVISCYASPNGSMEELENLLYDMQENIMHTAISEWLILGDLNCAI